MEQARPATSAAVSNFAWDVLRLPLFRNRWIASILSNIGSWMQDTAATWLMTSLTRSPLLIALMQTAASLPVLMMGLPAGAMADILDRRRLLIFWQTWMLAAAAVLSALTFRGMISPWTLLGLTLLLNIGSAMNNPAWQAIVPELVPRSQLPEAISLNSAGYNLARAVGPALGGLSMALFANVKAGAATVFAINAASFVFVIVVLYLWKRQPLYTSDLPTERMLGSIRSGLRYVHHSREMHGILIRAFMVTSCVAAMWALLAVVAQRDLKRGALGYGLLTASIGLGAVCGAVSLPKVRGRFSPDEILVGTSAIFALALLAMAFVHQTAIVMAALLAGGFAWTSTTSTFNIAVQTSAPAWVQARLLGTYQMTFQAGMAIGSAVWGAVAERLNTPFALTLAAATLILGLPFARRYRIPSGASVDLSSAASLARSDPTVVVEMRPNAGPVLISIRYQIDPEDADRFLAAVNELKAIRLRDGAMRWGLFQDAADPTRYVETFLVESWLEYLRQRRRMTVNDLAIRSKVQAFHKGEGRPQISRMIYTPTSEERPNAK